MGDTAEPIHATDPTTGVRQKVELSDSLQLAQAAAQGHRGAQREVFEQLRRSVHGTLYRVMGSNRHMEDLVQESFIEIFQSLATYKGQAKLTTWADRIVVRVAYRHFRAAKGQRLVASAVVETVQDPEEALSARDGLRRVYAALDTMSPSYRVSFALFAIDGRSVAEVAAATAVTTVAAKARIWRARQLLLRAAKDDPELQRYLGEGSVS